jgi:hypothetical protein
MRAIACLIGAGALAAMALGCMHSSEDVSASKATSETAAGQAAPKQAAPKPAAPEPADPVARPVAPDHKVDMSTNKTVTIKGLASVEHHQGGDTFAAYEPRAPVPAPIKAGDRLRLRLEVADDAWIYAVAAFQQSEYWKVGEWGPGVAAKGGVRIPWPDGHIVTDDEARMTTLFVIASAEELDWAQSLKREDCSALVGQMPPEPAKTACDHLYGLFWKVPKRIRGRVPPKVERLKYDSVNLPAIVSTHSGSPYTAVEWLFKPRQ